MDTRDARDVIPGADEARQMGNRIARDALDIFLSREGEMFTRSESVKLVSDELGVGEDEARRAVISLVGDIVDPVQQVPHPSGRYVGVIEYREYPDAGAYGYVHYSDRFGERKRVVCARCVEMEDLDEHVKHATQGEGTSPEDAEWGDLLDRVTAHYAEAHGQGPEGVEPGASLVSGTTMGGNQAWHDGNVSGGTDIDVSSQTIDFTGPDGGITTQATATGQSGLYTFESVTGGQFGVAAATNDGKVENRRGSFSNDGVPETFGRGSGYSRMTPPNTPGYIYAWNDAIGSAVGGNSSPADGRDYIVYDGDFFRAFHSETSGRKVYMYDLDTDTLGVVGGRTIDPLDGNANVNGSGITWDGDNYWIIETNNSYVYQLDTTFTVSGGFDPPGAKGIAYDPVDGNFVVVDNANSTLYRCDSSGTVLDSADSPSGFIRGDIQSTGDEIVTSAMDSLYVLDRSDLSLIEEQKAAAPRLDTLAWDGDNYYAEDVLAEYIYELDGSSNFDFTAGVVRQ